MSNALTLAALQDFIYCPMRYWWRKVAHLQEPETLDQVANTILREALLEYALIYWMETKPEPAVVQRAIRDYPETHRFQILVATLWGYKFIEWKQADLGRLLRRYSRADAEIVLNFVRGGEEYRRPDGSPYQAPRLTKVYEKLAREAGLPEMKQHIDETADKLPVTLRKGQSLADTYAQANGEIVADLVSNLPDWKGKVLKVDIPFKTQSNDLDLSGRADLLVQVERQPELVFFQYGHRLLPFKAYKNDLRIIAALLSAGEGWQRGQMNSIRIFNLLGEVRQERIYGPGRKERLEAVVELVRRSIRAGSYLPRFLRFEAYQTCRACPYQCYCIEGGGDILERMDPAGQIVLSQQKDRKARMPQ
ncbi:MAG: hypothetical protein JXA42_03950 [Anaerolineales bacterium]|nr:hypothetical protein [Anaerolineales bacterium]